MCQQRFPVPGRELGGTVFVGKDDGGEAEVEVNAEVGAAVFAGHALLPTALWPSWCNISMGKGDLGKRIKNDPMHACTIVNKIGFELTYMLREKVITLKCHLLMLVSLV